MLVLSRQPDESIVIDDYINVIVVAVQGDKVRLGIEAPLKASVHRREVWNAIRRERGEACTLDSEGKAGKLLREAKALLDRVSAADRVAMSELREFDPGLVVDDSLTVEVETMSKAIALFLS